MVEIRGSLQCIPHYLFLPTTTIHPVSNRTLGICTQDSISNNAIESSRNQLLIMRLTLIIAAFASIAMATAAALPTVLNKCQEAPGRSFCGVSTFTGIARTDKCTDAVACCCSTSTTHLTLVSNERQRTHLAIEGELDHEFEAHQSADANTNAQVLLRCVRATSSDDPSEQSNKQLLTLIFLVVASSSMTHVSHSLCSVIIPLKVSTAAASVPSR